MNNDLISIIVPVYNDEKYIRKCIECLINQTYKNIEILLIVDGATDNSESICREYSQKDSRVVVYTKTNGGTADTRNFGISKAKGTYVGFMDTDDYATNDFVETLYQGIIETGAPISCISLQEVDENEAIRTTTYRSSEYVVMNKIEAITNLFNDDKYGNFVWNKLFKKELFDNVKFKKIKKIEDLAIMYLVFDQIDFIVFNASKLYFYVQRQKSQLHKKELQIFITKIITIRERYIYIKNKYPEIIDNYIDYLKVIVECYPFIFLKKDLRKQSIADFNELYVKYGNYLTKKEKKKATLFRLI